MHHFTLLLLVASATAALPKCDFVALEAELALLATTPPTTYCTRIFALGQEPCTSEPGAVREHVKHVVAALPTGVVRYVMPVKGMELSMDVRKSIGFEFVYRAAAELAPREQKGLLGIELCLYDSVYTRMLEKEDRLFLSLDDDGDQE